MSQASGQQGLWEEDLKTNSLICKPGNTLHKDAQWSLSWSYLHDKECADTMSQGLCLAESSQLKWQSPKNTNCHGFFMERKKKKGEFLQGLRRWKAPSFMEINIRWALRNFATMGRADNQRVMEGWLLNAPDLNSKQVQISLEYRQTGTVTTTGETRRVTEPPSLSPPLPYKITFCFADRYSTLSAEQRLWEGSPAQHPGRQVEKGWAEM